jgi:hypothetical protein
LEALQQPVPLSHGLVLLYAAVGAMSYWARWGRRSLRVLGLARLLDDLVPIENQLWAVRVEFVLFVALGCFIGVPFVQPTNFAQSFAAGFAWVGLFTTMHEPGKLNKSRKNE